MREQTRCEDVLRGSHNWLKVKGEGIRVLFG